MYHIIKWVAWILAVIGALNWGLVGLFDINIVATLFGTGSTLTMVVYDLVGLSALVLIGFKIAKIAKTKKKK